MTEFVNYCTGTNDSAGHGDSIEDGLLHYFACLKFSERDDFLASLNETDKLRLRIEEELARTTKLRNILEAEGLKTETGKLLRSFKTTLSQRLGPRQRSQPPVERPENVPASQASTSKPKKNLEDEVAEVVLGDLRANVIYFKKKSDERHPRPYDHPALSDTFPNQRVPLSLLLQDNPKENPLMWKCEEDMIRYFHIPANNMSWIEVMQPVSTICSLILILFKPRTRLLDITMKRNPTSTARIASRLKELRN
jgi:hypothetical protein